jgi:ribosomal-protein-alanine N-acetyltransferase
MPLTFHRMDEISARAIQGWQYSTPYDVYNLDSVDNEETVQLFLDPQNGYHSIADERGDLVAYCCFGLDAQVPGGDYGLSALDIGLGVRPDLTGLGRGLTYVTAVLQFARGSFEAAVFRVTIAEFNKRALRLWKKAGFRPVQTFTRKPDGMSFVVLTRTGKQVHTARSMQHRGNP